MKILIISQNFPPDIGGAAIRLSGYAKYLSLFGHTVTVLCANPIYPRGKIFEEYKNKWFQKEIKDGYTVVHTWIWPIKPKSHAILRIMSYCSFVFSACLGSLRLEKPDIIISATPSLFSSFVSIFYKKTKKVKILLDITDVWPDSAIATGFMKKGLLFSFAKKIERWIYNNATHITCGSRGTKRELLKNKVLEEKITIIPDATDLEMFSADLDTSNIMKEYGLENKFIVGYVGLLGFAQDPDKIVLAAKELESHKDIIFLVVGGGGLKEKTENLAEKLNLSNIIFTGERPRKDMPYFIKTFSIGLVTLAIKDLFRNSVPGKIFDYMSASKPVIVNIDGVAWEIAQEAKAGILSKDNDPGDLAEKILYLYNHREESLEMGRNGRKYVEENYDREKTVRKLEDIINKIID